MARALHIYRPGSSLAQYAKYGPVRFTGCAIDGKSLTRANASMNWMTTPNGRMALAKSSSPIDGGTSFRVVQQPGGVPIGSSSQ
jgi:hypothetical protein